MPPVGGNNRGSAGFLYFPERPPHVATYSNVAPGDMGADPSADALRKYEIAPSDDFDHGQLFEPVRKKNSSKNKKNGLAPVKQPRAKSAMDMIDNGKDSGEMEIRVRDEQIKVLTEANMELATKLQLLEEAMVGADSIMERRTEMMRALAEENQDLLAMVEQAETGQGVPQQGLGWSDSVPPNPTPFEAWPEKSPNDNFSPPNLTAGYEQDYFAESEDGHSQDRYAQKSMPGVHQARMAIENGVQRLQRHRPLIGQEERAMAMGAYNDSVEDQVEMRDIIGQIEGLDRDIFDGPLATRKMVEKAVPLQMIDEKEVVRLRVETHALRMFKLKCNEEITAKEREMQQMGLDLGTLKKKLAESEAAKFQLAENVRLHEEEVRQMTDQYAMMTNRYHDEEELRVRLAEDLRATEAKVKILEEEAFIMRTRNSAVVNKWVKARHRAVEHELKEQLDELNNMLNEEESARAKAEEDLQRKQIEVEMMRERHHCLLNDLAEAQEETKMARKAKEEADEARKLAEEEVGKLQIELVAAEEKNNVLKVQIKEQQNEIDELQKVKDAMLGKVKELEKEIADLKKTLQQIYQKHAEQLRKVNAEWEEKTAILKSYIKNKEDENRTLLDNNATLTKSNQLMTAKISEFEKNVAAKVEEIKALKESHGATVAKIREEEQTKQDVLKMYARTKDGELREQTEKFDEMTKRFNAEELRRQKRDVEFNKLEEDHTRLGRRYLSLQNGYDREMSSRERLEQTMLEQERTLKTELQRLDQFHRKKFQELGEKETDTLHKLNFEMAAREDAEMTLIHKQEEIFELRNRVVVIQDAKDQADKLQSLVDEESRQLHTRVRELLQAIEVAQKGQMDSDERCQKAEKTASDQVEQVRSETNMVLEQKLQELRGVEEKLKNAEEEIMAMTIAIENERLQAAKDLATRDDEIAKLRSENERMDFEITENAQVIQKSTEDAEIALREVQALRERSPETLSSLKDEKIRNLDALEKSLEARLKKAEDARVLATTEQRAEEKKVRDLKIELMESQNQLEQFKREFLSKEQLMSLSATAEGGDSAGPVGGAYTDIEDPVSRKELQDATDKLEDLAAELADVDKQLRIEERLKIKAQNELKDKERELHRFLNERDLEVRELVEKATEEELSNKSAAQRKEKERMERKNARNKEREDNAKSAKLTGSAADAVAAEDAYSEADKEKFKKVFDLVRFNKYKDVEKLIKDGCPVDWRDPNGYTPLMVASQNGLKRIVKICMRYSCDLNAQNNRLQTASHLATMYDHGDLMEYMISKGARDDILNEQGKTCHEATK